VTDDAGAPAGIHIVESASPDEVDAVRHLFREYAESLGWDASSGGWMTDELASLPGPYAPPLGSLMLAYVGDRSAGALGLQPVPEGVRMPDVGAETAGELKRMFVRPEFRRHGVGRALLARAEAEARVRGYNSLVLTTSAEMMPLAQHLYESMGYVETAPYRDDMPYPHIRWMRLGL
jgi:GNAT superfamily N-acetyltransferase